MGNKQTEPIQQQPPTNQVQSVGKIPTKFNVGYNPSKHESLIAFIKCENRQHTLILNQTDNFGLVVLVDLRKSLKNPDSTSFYEVTVHGNEISINTFNIEDIGMFSTRIQIASNSRSASFIEPFIRSIDINILSRITELRLSNTFLNEGTIQLINQSFAGLEVLDLRRTKLGASWLEHLKLNLRHLLISAYYIKLDQENHNNKSQKQQYQLFFRNLHKIRSNKLSIEGSLFGKHMHILCYGILQEEINKSDEVELPDFVRTFKQIQVELIVESAGYIDLETISRAQHQGIILNINFNPKEEICQKMSVQKSS